MFHLFLSATYAHQAGGKRETLVIAQNKKANMMKYDYDALQVAYFSARQAAGTLVLDIENPRRIPHRLTARASL